MEHSGLGKFRGDLYEWCESVELLLGGYNGSSAWYPIVVESGV